MSKDPELEGMVGIIEHQLQKGVKLTQIIPLLEHQGFDHEKIRQAILLAEGEKHHNKNSWNQVFQEFISVNTIKPIFYYVILQIMICILILLTMSPFLNTSFGFDIYQHAVVFIFLCIVGIILSVCAFLVDGYILHRIALYFVNDGASYSYTTALWIIFWSNSLSVYITFFAFISLHAKSAVGMILVSFLLMFIITYALVCFFYSLRVGKALQLILCYAVTKFFLEAILYFAINLIVFIIMGNFTTVR